MLGMRCWRSANNLLTGDPHLLYTYRAWNFLCWSISRVKYGINMEMFNPDACMGASMCQCALVCVGASVCACSWERLCTDHRSARNLDRHGPLTIALYCSTFLKWLFIEIEYFRPLGQDNLLGLTKSKWKMLCKTVSGNHSIIRLLWVNRNNHGNLVHGI